MTNLNKPVTRYTVTSSIYNGTAKAAKKAAPAVGCAFKAAKKVAPAVGYAVTVATLSGGLALTTYCAAKNEVELENGTSTFIDKSPTDIGMDIVETYAPYIKD